MGASLPPKETTATTKERPNLLLEVKTKTNYGLKMMARKFRKYGQIERILMHLQKIMEMCSKDVEGMLKTFLDPHKTIERESIQLR